MIADKNHEKREREHRVLAVSAATEEVRRVHLELADQYAANWQCKLVVSDKTPYMQR